MSLARFKTKLKLLDLRDADRQCFPKWPDQDEMIHRHVDRYEHALRMPALRSDRKDAVRIPGMLVLVPANDGYQFS